MAVKKAHSIQWGSHFDITLAVKAFGLPSSFDIFQGT
jgi:hypothetical protein